MLDNAQATVTVGPLHQHAEAAPQLRDGFGRWHAVVDLRRARGVERYLEQAPAVVQLLQVEPRLGVVDRSEEHTSELQSLMRISYAVFCLKTKNIPTENNTIYLQNLNHN